MRFLWDGLSLLVYAAGVAVAAGFALDGLPYEGAVGAGFFLFFYLVLRVALDRYCGIVRRVREDVEAYTGRPVASTGVLRILEEPDPPPASYPMPERSATRPPAAHADHCPGHHIVEHAPWGAAPMAMGASSLPAARGIVVDDTQRVVARGRGTPQRAHTHGPAARFDPPPAAPPPAPAAHPLPGSAPWAPLWRIIVRRLAVVFGFGALMSLYAGIAAAVGASVAIGVLVGLWTYILPPDEDFDRNPKRPFNDPDIPDLPFIP